MICILHGWLLEGSGSNLWTRSVVTALARAGETVHLVCQENHPSLYEAIAEAYKYGSDGTRVETLKRDVAFAGRGILHQPWIGETLPVFVWDKYEEFGHVVPMIELPDDVLETYIERNFNVVKRIVQEHDITAIHANHAVLMSVVAQRVSRETGVPFAIMPHGSGIEYAVKKDERFLRYASSAFTDAGRIFVIGAEMRQRVNDVFKSVPDVDAKCVELHLGVDTSQFDPVTVARRAEKITSLHASLADVPRGRTRSQSESMLENLSGDMSLSDLRKLFAESAHYDAKSPDADVEEKLATVNWDTDPTLLFTGRIVSMKGLQAVIAAIPLILERVPDLRLIVVGHGPLREPMEAFIWALENGDRKLAENVVAWGRALEGDPEGDASSSELASVTRLLERLEKNGGLDDYFTIARKNVRRDRVIFTGYLTHSQLRFLFPCCDVGIFPSIVREAGPLVFLEALASGCFPLGTYMGGMAASIDAVAEVVPADVAAAMKLDPDDTVSDIVRHVPLALTIGVKHKDVLARLARDRYDWTSVAATLESELESLRSSPAN